MYSAVRALVEVGRGWFRGPCTIARLRRGSEAFGMHACVMVCIVNGEKSLFMFTNDPILLFHAHERLMFNFFKGA